MPLLLTEEAPLLVFQSLLRFPLRTVWNKLIKGKQCTICFHVDNCKILHVILKVINNMIAWLHQKYKSIFTYGSKKMKVARGKVHKYLGMMLDFVTAKMVKFTMIDDINEVIKT